MNADTEEVAVPEAAADCREAILEQHRQEKKELQVTITKLRHSLGRTNKRRKKEMLAEIEALEMSLKDKQERELQDLAESIAAIAATLEVEPNGIEPTLTTPVEQVVADEHQQPETSGATSLETKENHRTTKASRRRDQKERKERERLERIKTGQVDDANNIRLIEMKQVEGRLMALGLSIYEIASDGDCMYKAIEHQMRLTRSALFTVEELRSKCGDYIRRHKDDFIPFLVAADGDSLMSDDEFDEYCNKIETTKTWGGQPELRALSNSLQVPIEVIQAEGSSVEIGFNEFDAGHNPLILCYFKHAYQLGEHYNSVTPNRDEEEEGEEWRQGTEDD